MPRHCELDRSKEMKKASDVFTGVTVTFTKVLTIMYSNYDIFIILKFTLPLFSFMPLPPFLE
jgi:hypothetical protein